MDKLALSDWVAILGGAALVVGLLLNLRQLRQPAASTALRLEKISADLEYIKEKVTQSTEGVARLTVRVDDLDKRLSLLEHDLRE